MNWFSQICTSLAFGLLVGSQAQAVSSHGLLLQDGKLLGWGNNQYGQLGAGQPPDWPKARALSLPGGHALAAVAAGGRHSVALDRAGRVWAWGDNSSGQLGQGHTRPLTDSVQVPLPARALMLAAGGQHTVALLANGTVWAWGGNTLGQLGNGAIDAFAPAPAPAQVSLPPDVQGTTVKAVVAGDDFSLARLADGRVLQWGGGTAQPSLVTGLPAVQRIRARGVLAMAQDAKGRFWQWDASAAATTKPHPSTARAYAELAAPMPPPTHSALAAAPAASAVSGASRSPAPQAAQNSREVRTGTSAGQALPVRPPGARADSGATPAPAPVTTSQPPASGTLASAPGPAPVPPPARPELRQNASETPAVRPSTPKAEPALTTTAGTSPPSTLAVPAASVPQAAAPTATAPRATAPARALQISGRVLLVGSRTDGLEQAQVSADGAQCSATDTQGRFSCTVPMGWSGRLVVRKNNFRISPNALSYRNLQGDASGQDFAAAYDPR